jgi:hypothetical protein
MDTLIIILLVTIAFILTTWLVYNFWWLARSQLYLVMNPNGPFAFNKATVTFLETALGGTLGTLNQLIDASTTASVCAFGWLDCTGCTGATGYCGNIACKNVANPGYGAWAVLNVDGVTGNYVPNCGPNGLSSNNTAGTSNYWIYGKKPVNNTIVVDGVTWTIMPWIDNGNFKGPTVYNKFELFGIPKIL